MVTSNDMEWWHLDYTTYEMGVEDMPIGVSLMIMMGVAAVTEKDYTFTCVGDRGSWDGFGVSIFFPSFMTLEG